MFSLFHSTELSWIAQLHSAVRTPWLDVFFKGYHYLDSPLFTLFLISLVWSFYRPKIALRILYIALLSYITSSLLKWFFALPRPCHIIPSLGLKCPHSYGFPSGAAQTATLLITITFYEVKRGWKLKIASMIVGILLCFSRVYLGVHYFSDLLGGIVVGAFLFLLYVKLPPMIEKQARFFQTSLYLILTPLAVWTSFSHLEASAVFWAILSLSAGIALSPLSITTIEMQRYPLKIRLGSFFLLFGGFAILETFFFLLRFSFSFPAGLSQIGMGISAGFWIGYVSPKIVSSILNKKKIDQKYK